MPNFLFLIANTVDKNSRPLKFYWLNGKKGFSKLKIGYLALRELEVTISKYQAPTINFKYRYCYLINEKG
jgi:hypothetical protein